MDIYETLKVVIQIEALTDSINRIDELLQDTQEYEMLVKQKESKMQEFRELMQQLYCSEVPLRYWYSEAIIWMIDTLETQKAHNLDEALILYEEELNNRANIRRQMMKIIKKYLK